MARARNIKPSFFANEELAEVSLAGRLLFIGLWTIADREGRLEDRPKRIKAQIFPYEDQDADSLLQDLCEHGFINRYEVSGDRFIQVTNFTKHQNPHVKECKSTIPAPCFADSSRSASTLLAPDEHESSHADSLLLIPDSLIPDTGFPKPASQGVDISTDGNKNYQGGTFSPLTGEVFE